MFPLSLPQISTLKSQVNECEVSVFSNETNILQAGQWQELNTSLEILPRNQHCMHFPLYNTAKSLSNKNRESHQRLS